MDSISQALVTQEDFKPRPTRLQGESGAGLCLLERQGSHRDYLYLLSPADGLSRQGAQQLLAEARRLLAAAAGPTTVVLVCAARETSELLFQLRHATQARPGSAQALLVWLADAASGTLYAHPGWPLRMPPGHASVQRTLKAQRQGDAGVAARRPAPRDLPLVSFGFIGLFVLWWLAMELSGGSQNTQVLVGFGAQFNPLVEAGQYWRLVSHLFLHIGLAHLLFNGITLFWVGPIIERIYGRGRFLIIFFVAGLGGGLATFFLYVDPVVSAGASGALFGFFGALGYHAWNQPRWSSTRSHQLRIVWLLVGANIVFGLMHPTVNNTAHMGGLVAGVLASAAVGKPGKASTGHRAAAAVMAVLLVTGGFYVRALLLG